MEHKSCWIVNFNLMINCVLCFYNNIKDEKMFRCIFVWRRGRLLTCKQTTHYYNLTFTHQALFFRHMMYKENSKSIWNYWNDYLSLKLVLHSENTSKHFLIFDIIIETKDTVYHQIKIYNSARLMLHQM
jgi:hypothetical protein